MLSAKIKRELLSVSSGEEWNAFITKYPQIKGGDLDTECAEHINKLIGSNAKKEVLENPHIHYEAF